MSEKNKKAIAGEAGPLWYAVYVCSRHEKNAHRKLQEKGIESFLPLAETWRQWSDRRKKIIEPLFKGYVFVKCSYRADCSRILDTESVVRFVGVNRIPSVIRERDIEWIRALLRAPESLGACVDAIPPGRKVRVIAGPFRGLEGTVLRRGRDERVVIFFDSIMQGIEVAIAAEMLKVIAPDIRDVG